MAFPGRTLSFIIVALIQVVCVSCQCDNTPVAVHVPHYQVIDIRSPGYPANYGINLNCSWIISSDNVTDIFFVRIENVFVDCNGDALLLKELKTNTKILSFCGDAITSDIYIQSEGLKVEFLTNAVQRLNDKGFRVRVTSIPKPSSDVDTCTSQNEVELQAEKKTKMLMSPNFPNKYPSNLNCQWRIVSKPGYAIQVNLDIYDIEYATTPPQDPVDFLQIRKIANISTLPIKYSGRWKFDPVQLVSTGSVGLTFISDGDTSYAGFLLRYKLMGSGLELSAVDRVSKTEESMSVLDKAPATDGNKVAVIQNTRSTTEDTLFTSQENRSTTEDSLTTEHTLSPSQEAMSTTEDSLFSTQETRSTTDDTLTTEHTLLSSQEAMSTTESTLTTMSTTETILSSSDKGIYTKQNKMSTEEDITSTLDTGYRTKTTTQVESGTESIHTTGSEVTPKSDITEIQTSDVTQTLTSNGSTEVDLPGVSKLTTSPVYTKKDIINRINSMESGKTRDTQEQNESSCDVYKCVIPLVISIGLFLSVLCLVFVVLGARRSRRRYKYRIGDAKGSQTLVTLAKTKHDDFNL